MKICFKRHSRPSSALAARRTLNWSREKVQDQLLKDITSLQVEFPDKAWMHELVPLLREMHEIAGETQPSAGRLRDLKSRVEAVLRQHKLKGFAPYLWIIEDCLEKQNDT
jgi:hypothetical protein